MGREMWNAMTRDPECTEGGITIRITNQDILITRSITIMKKMQDFVITHVMEEMGLLIPVGLFYHIRDNIAAGGGDEGRLLEYSLGKY